MPAHQPSIIKWCDGVPISTHFSDPYYSLENGLAEFQHVFMSGNKLPQRFGDGFHIAELGFGTGLNLLGAITAWRNSGTKGKLYYTSFEAFPLQYSQMAKAHQKFQELNRLSVELEPLWSSEFELPDLKFQLILGDARHTLPAWPFKADAWFLDGFSPAKNPELWGPILMKEVASHTNSGGSFATYTAAGFVRRGLQESGFKVERIAGFKRKRHMTIGTKT